MEKSNVIRISNYQKKKCKDNQSCNKSYEELISETYADQLANDFKKLLEKEKEKEREICNPERGK